MGLGRVSYDEFGLGSVRLGLTLAHFFIIIGLNLVICFFVFVFFMNRSVLNFFAKLEFFYYLVRILNGKCKPIK